MRKNILVATLLLSTCIYAQTKVTDENFTPFYTTDEAPKMEQVLPGPPSLTDAQFFYDWSQYQWGKSIRETERGQQAIADAGLNASYFMKRFGEAIGRDLTPENHPNLYRLISRMHLTEQQAGASAKRYFARHRPYQQFQEHSSVPNSESATDFTSYPSGHTHISWLVGLTLTALDPTDTEAIMKVAYELGQSRVIVGFHYQSDVDAGRIMGSVTFARLWANEEFQKMFQKAKKEF